MPLSLLKRYAFSATKTLLFCPVCGTPMFFQYSTTNGHLDPMVDVFTGTLSVDADIELIRITDHIYVGDTIDGGASVWMTHPTPDGTPAQRWLKGKDVGKELPVDWPATLQKTPAATTTEATTDDTKTMAAGNRTSKRAANRKIDKDAAKEAAREAANRRKSSMGREVREALAEKSDGRESVDLLQGTGMQCQCGGFSLLFKPDIADINCRFVDPSSKQVLAALDGCNTCRLTSGVDIFPWIYTPPSILEFLNTGGMDSLLKSGVLSRYRPPGKEDAAWYFCNGCSATVAYEERREETMVALAAGLLTSPTGAGRRTCWCGILSSRSLTKRMGLGVGGSGWFGESRTRLDSTWRGGALI